MQAYGEKLAHVYNMKWGAFAERAAPRIMDFYEATAAGSRYRTLLDIGCGTGQLAVHFLNHGYRIVGIDASLFMLRHARNNAGSYAAAGHSHFIQADAGRFALRSRFGLAVSTFDTINHLDNEAQLAGCFQSARDALVEEGFFIFDLNTRRGLQRWHNTEARDSSEEMTMIQRGCYHAQAGKAEIRIQGLIYGRQGACEPFEETHFNTVFDLERVKAMLLQTGWRRIHFARIDDLRTPLEDPEQEARVFAVATQ